METQGGDQEGYGGCCWQGGRCARVLRTATSGDWGGSWLRPPRFSWARKHATHATRATQAACTTYFIYDKKGRASERDGRMATTAVRER